MYNKFMKSYFPIFSYYINV